MLKFEKVDTEPKFAEWREYASEFGHDCASPIMPIITISRNNTKLAHYHLLTLPIILPAFHPEKCSPRDFRESIDAVAHAACLSSMSPQFPNGVCYAALPTGDKRVLNDSLINKVGFVDMQKSLYRRVP